MELYGGNYSHTQEILRTMAYDVPQAFPIKSYEDISGSVTSTHHNTTANPTITKTNFKPLLLDTIVHTQPTTSKEPRSNRDTSFIEQIEASRTAIRPHNTFKSDYILIDY
jgi:hypothetical protein